MNLWEILTTKLYKWYKGHEGVADAHHTPYTDPDAIAAIAADDSYVKNTGDVITGQLQIEHNFLMGNASSSRSMSGYVGSTFNDWYALASNIYVIPYVGWKYLANGFGGLAQFSSYRTGLTNHYFSILFNPKNTSGANAAITQWRENMRVFYDGKTLLGYNLTTQIATATLDIVGDVIRLRNSKTPATAGAAGNQGDICWDANYIYVCVSANTWKRSAIATW